MSKCSKCNEEYNDSFGACPYCGTPNTNKTDTEVSEVQNRSAEYNDDFNSSGNNNNSIKENFGAGYEPQQEPPQNGKDDNKKKKTIIIGSVVGVIALIAVIVILLFGTGTVTVTDGGIVFSNNPSSPTNSGTTDSYILGTNPDGSYVTSGTLPDGTYVEYQTNPDGTIATDDQGRPILSPNSVYTGEPSNNGNSGVGNSAASSGSSSKNGNVSQGNNSSSKPNSQSSSQEGGSSQGGNSSQGGDSSGGSSEKVIEIGGEKFKVGDTVTITVYLSGINNPLQGISGELRYNSKLLQCDSKSVKLPNLPGVVYNSGLEDRILFNAANISGIFDFASEKVLLTANFTIADTDVTADSPEFVPDQVLGYDGEDVPEDEYTIRIEVVKA